MSRSMPEGGAAGAGPVVRPTAGEVPGGTGRGLNLVRALLVTARPKQWTKNLLVFGAPATAGVLLEPAHLGQATAAFLAFSLEASGVYFINDVVDREADRAHPRKRHRPVSAGELSPGLAGTTGLVLLGAGMVVGLLASGVALALVLAAYVLLAMSYTYALKKLVLLDIAAVAGGFLLRAVAGGVAVNVPLSSWFLLVASFGALFIATGKRHAEYVHLGDLRGDHRLALDSYSEPYLRHIQYSSSTAAIIAYCLWAFEGRTTDPLWSGLSIVPFVLGMYRYLLLVGEGRGEVPEELVLHDRQLQVFGLVWVLLVVTGVYLK